MPAYTAYELTLIIEYVLIVLEKSKQETANIVIICVYAGLYVHFGLHLYGTSPHILHYMRLTRLSITSSLIFS